jgi:hypothetical protein
VPSTSGPQQTFVKNRIGSSGVYSQRYDDARLRDRRRAYLLTSHGSGQMRGKGGPERFCLHFLRLSLKNSESLWATVCQESADVLLRTG